MNGKARLSDTEGTAYMKGKTGNFRPWSSICPKHKENRSRSQRGRHLSGREILLTVERCLGTPLSHMPKTIRPLPSLRVAIEWCIRKTDPNNTANAPKAKLTLEPQPREVGLKLVPQT